MAGLCRTAVPLLVLHLHSNIMKKFAFPVATLAFSLLLGSLAWAETVNIPEDDPAISLDVPHSWKPEVTDKGIACESPDQVATVYFEVTSEKDLHELIDENVDWLMKDQSVQVDKSSEQRQEFEAAGLKWQRISWAGESKDWGPATIGFLFTGAGKDKMLAVTYWVTKKDQDKRFPTMSKIIESVKLIGS
jgi:hypothetical protein